MSDDAAGNSFFADGIHEDLLTNLSYIPELKVVSRTSVVQYRDTTKPVSQIAAELGVGTLLEGSVRRSGDQVRVTAQLIDASTDEHIWAKNYDRKLEDIFAIQGELAKAITDALRIALTTEQADAFAERPTQNLEAYELFLKEQELVDREGNSEERQWQSIAMMQQAVKLDPDFAKAWANLGVLHAQAYFWERDKSEKRRELATQAIERAIALDPSDLDVRTYAGSYDYYGFRDYTKAAENYQRVLDVAPHHIDALASMGFIRRREGQWAESIRYHKRVLELDPRHIGRHIAVITGLTLTYPMLRQWNKAVALQQILVDWDPGDITREALLVQFQANRDKSPQPLHDFVARYPDLATSDQPAFVNYRLRERIVNRDWEGLLALHEKQPTRMKGLNGYEFHRVIALRITGRSTESEEARKRIIAETEASGPNSPEQNRMFRIILAHYLIGNATQVRQLAANYGEFLAQRNDAMEEFYGLATTTLVSVWTAPQPKP